MEKIEIREDGKKIVKVKQSPSIHLAQDLLGFLRANSLDLFEDEEYKTHFYALCNRVEQLLDVGKAIDIVDIYIYILRHRKRGGIAKNPPVFLGQNSCFFNGTSL